jgi:hypothetical protein
MGSGERCAGDPSTRRSLHKLPASRPILHSAALTKTVVLFLSYSHSLFILSLHNYCHSFSPVKVQADKNHPQYYHQDARLCSPLHSRYLVHLRSLHTLRPSASMAILPRLQPRNDLMPARLRREPPRYRLRAPRQQHLRPQSRSRHPQHRLHRFLRQHQLPHRPDTRHTDLPVPHTVRYGPGWSANCTL